MAQRRESTEAAPDLTQGQMDEAVNEVIAKAIQSVDWTFFNENYNRQAEEVVRALNRPILTVTDDFHEPQRVMIAFDGGVVTRRGVAMVAGSPLFRGLPITLLMAGKPVATGRLSLIGNEFSCYKGGKLVQRRRIESADGLAALLADEFAIALPEHPGLEPLLERIAGSNPE